MVVHPSGKYLYVANAGQGENDVSLFDINSDGTVSEVTPRTPVGTLPFLLAMDPAGNYLYVANALSNNISVFSIASSTGALSPVTGSPFQINFSPKSMAISPSGNFLYVSAPSSPSGIIAVFSVTAGVLSSTPMGITSTADNNPSGIAIDSQAAHISMPRIRRANSISIYSIASSRRILNPGSSVASRRPLSEPGCTDRGSDRKLSVCSQSRVQQHRDLFDHGQYRFSCRSYGFAVWRGSSSELPGNRSQWKIFVRGKPDRVRGHSGVWRKRREFELHRNLFRGQLSHFDRDIAVVASRRTRGDVSCSLRSIYAIVGSFFKCENKQNSSTLRQYVRRHQASRCNRPGSPPSNRERFVRFDQLRGGFRAETKVRTHNP